MEEGNQSGDLAISGGHGNAQEVYAMRRRRRRWVRASNVPCILHLVICGT